MVFTIAKPKTVVETLDKTKKQPRSKPKTKRVKNNRGKFQKLCQKIEIPYPVNIENREIEHLDCCSDCAKTWPLFYDFEISHHNKSLEHISSEWFELSESKRREYYRDIKKVVISTFTSRTPSGYQLFFSDHSSKNKKLSFGDMSKAIATRWQVASLETRLKYATKSEKMKAEKQNELENLTTYKKILFSDVKSSLKKRKRKNPYRISKPQNMFMLYLRDRWNDEKRKLDGKKKYRTLMNLVSIEWNNMTDQQKLPYKKQFELQKLSRKKQRIK
jgi:hypothetical protein